MPFPALRAVFFNPLFTDSPDSNFIRTIFPCIISTTNNFKLLWIVLI